MRLFPGGKAVAMEGTEEVNISGSNINIVRHNHTVYPSSKNSTLLILGCRTKNLNGSNPVARHVGRMPFSQAQFIEAIAYRR